MNCCFATSCCWWSSLFFVDNVVVCVLSFQRRQQRPAPLPPTPRLPRTTYRCRRMPPIINPRLRCPPS